MSDYKPIIKELSNVQNLRSKIETTFKSTSKIRTLHKLVFNKNART